MSGLPGGPLFVVSDVHGHDDQLADALRTAGLVDRSGHWCGGQARLWFLGDYVDRGPDGIGVIDRIRSLQRQAPDGQVLALLGNHEIQFLAADRFGAAPVAGWPHPDGMIDLWRLWGGRDGDLARLTDEHRAWLYGLPAVALVDDYLLLHSDTDAYLRYGATVEEVNVAISLSMASTEPRDWLSLAYTLSDRSVFQGADGQEAAERVLGLGGHTIVHGHSTLTSFFGVDPTEVSEPVVYAGGRVVAVDGGAYEGGRVLVPRLPPR